MSYFDSVLEDYWFGNQTFNVRKIAQKLKNKQSHHNHMIISYFFLSCYIERRRNYIIDCIHFLFIFYNFTRVFNIKIVSA